MPAEREIVEGATRLMVPEAYLAKERGPGKRQGEPFYNKAMATSRDLSVLMAHDLVSEHTGRRPPELLDGLAGIGARGIRWRVEVQGECTVILNDLNPGAAEQAARNAKLNGAEVAVVQRDLASLLHEDHFRMVDVDPFGTPAPFLDAAARGTANGGVIAVTATDAPALNGVHPRVCERRYGAKPLKGPFSHETAVRILLGAVTRAAARYERGVEPLLAYWEDHHYRVVARLRNGATRADESLAHLGYAHHCLMCGARWVYPERERACTCRRPPAFAGPLWTGHLFDAAYVARLQAAAHTHTLARPRRVATLLDAWAGEAAMPPLLYDLHELGRVLLTDIPRTQTVLETLRGQGFLAGRTHFNVHAVKTDAPMAALVRCLKGEL